GAIQESGRQTARTAGKAKHADAVSVRIFQEANRHSDVQPVRPLNWHAAVRTSEVALVGAGEGQIVRPKRARAPPDGPWVATRQWRGVAPAGGRCCVRSH